MGGGRWEGREPLVLPSLNQTPLSHVVFHAYAFVYENGSAFTGRPWTCRVRSKLLYWAFTCLQTVYSPDLSNLLFHFIALSLSFRFIVLLAACPRHADTILSLKLFLSPSSSPFFPSLPIAMLPSRPHSIPPSYVLPNSSAWNYILSSSITCAFITSLRVGMSVASLDGELPGELTRPCVLHMPDMMQMCAAPLREQFPR